MSDTLTATMVLIKHLKIVSYRYFFHTMLKYFTAIMLKLGMKSTLNQYRHLLSSTLSMTKHRQLSASLQKK